MTQTCTEEKYIYRPVPCPAWDMPAMEAWLEHMAAQGLHLSREGFLLGFGTFTRGVPARVRYCLDAAPRRGGFLSQEEDGPADDALALLEAYGWEYVCRRGQFFICRTQCTDARPLHTDAAVHALTLRAVRRKRACDMAGILFWSVVYPLVLLRGGLLLSILHARSWFCLFALALLIWYLVQSIGELRMLHRLQKGQQPPQCPVDTAGWRRRTRRHVGKNALHLTLLAVFALLALRSMSNDLLAVGQVPLQTPPAAEDFATMADFAGQPVTDYAAFMGADFNYTKRWTDWLAPANIDYCEHATLTLADGSRVEGGLYVDYHRLRFPALARLLAWEYRTVDARSGESVPQDVGCPLPVEGAWFYSGAPTHFPTVVLLQGDTVIHARFFQTGPQEPLSPASWVGALAQSLQTAP